MKKKGLGELLVEKGLIDLAQLEEARREKKAKALHLTSVLVEKGFVSDEDIVNVLSEEFNVPIIDLGKFEIDPELIKLVPRRICEKHRVIPIQKAGRTLVVAFADPSNIYVKDDLSLLTRCKIEAVLSTDSAIVATIETHYGDQNKMSNLMSEMMGDSEGMEVGVEDDQLIDKEADIDDGPIIKFVNAMLAEAIRLKASDIHVEPYEKRLRVRFRIDGVLHEKTQPPVGAASTIVSRIKVLCRMDIAQKRLPQDGRFKVKTKQGHSVDFRVNCLPTAFGEKVVLRILDKANLQVSVERIGFEDRDKEIFEKMIAQPQGMILITGPTGSGKTTTIYSALAERNKVTTNISTAEDPVEFHLDGINQVQVNPEIGFTFPMALRAFLRQDPEVIMVGEIRDLETASIAYKAASTGHLVVSTLHTNDAVSTINRLVNMGVPAYVIAEATSLVVAQRLIKTNCGRCSVPHEVPADVLKDIGVKESNLDKFKELRKGEGCTQCNQTGLSGRMAIFEVMEMTGVVKEAILRGDSPRLIKKYAVQSGGMHTLRQSALLKLMRGQTSVEEVVNVSVDDDFGDENLGNKDGGLKAVQSEAAV